MSGQLPARCQMLFVLALLVLVGIQTHASATEFEPLRDHIGLYMDTEAQVCEATLGGIGQTVRVHVLAVLPDHPDITVSACQFRIAGLPPSSPPDGIWWAEWTSTLTLGNVESGISLAWTTPPQGPIVEIGTITFMSLYGEDWIGADHLLEAAPDTSLANLIVVEGQSAMELIVGGGRFTFNCSEPPCTPCFDNSEPICSLSDDLFFFGNVDIGESEDQSFTIQNLTDGALAGFVSEDCPDFEVVDGAGAFSLTGGQEHAFTVRFSPTISGMQICEVDLGTPRCGVLRCSGRGTGEASCLLTPDHLDFGELVVGGSQDLGFRFTNISDALLTGYIVESCPDFRIITGGGQYFLLSGESRDIVVRFSPTTSGEQSCNISISNAGCPAMPCTGSAQDEPFGCALSANELDFGSIPYWRTATLGFSISNVGESPLSGELGIEGEYFHLSQGAGPFLLQPNETLHGEATFQPTVPGLFSGRVTTGLGDCPQIVCIGTATTGGDDPFLGLFADDVGTVCDMDQQPLVTARVKLLAVLPEWLPRIAGAEFRITNLPAAGSGGLITYDWGASGTGGEPDTDLTLIFNPPLLGPVANLGSVEFLEFEPDWIGSNHEMEIAPGLVTGALIVLDPLGYEYLCEPGLFTFNCTGYCPCYFSTPVALSAFALADLGGAARATWRYEGGGDAEFRLEGERDGFSWEVAWQQTAPGQYEAEDHAAALATAGSVSYRLLGRLPGEEWQLLRDETLAVSGRHYRTGLAAAHPNPFNPQVTLPFSLAAAGRARLAVYDVAGRLVRELLNEQRPAGEHALVWDGRDDAGRGVGTGVYFVRLEAAGTSESQKLVLLR